MLLLPSAFERRGFLDGTGGFLSYCGKLEGDWTGRLAGRELGITGFLYRYCKPDSLRLDGRGIQLDLEVSDTMFG